MKPIFGMNVESLKLKERKRPDSRDAAIADQNSRKPTAVDREQVARG